jgi:MFS family permease
MDGTTGGGQTVKTSIPRNIWLVGWVSFFMDVSSEMVYPLVPLFLSNQLGASKSVVGLIEGIAEATASLLKLGSGALADRFGKNKLLMGLGYGLSTVSRPVMALASGWGTVLASRWIDRTGKGIRTAPRDAIIAASTTADRLGLSFGLHRAMDSAGAVIGPAVALLVLMVWPADYRLVFWLSIIPGVLAVALIIGLVKADGRPRSSRKNWVWSLGGFNAGFVRFLLVIGLFSLGNASNVFLILRAENIGLAPAWISGCYLLFNAVYAVTSLPAGMLADRIGRPVMLVAGFVLFSGIYVGFAVVTAAWLIPILFVLYGLYMGVTDGVQRAHVATLLPANLTATGYGLYHMVIGLAILPASFLAGLLWDQLGPSAPFWFGAGTSLSAAALFASYALVRPEPA